MTQSQWREVDSKLARSWVGEELKSGVWTKCWAPILSCAFRVLLDKQPRAKGWEKEGGSQVRGLLSQGMSTSSRPCFSCDFSHYVTAPDCVSGPHLPTEISLSVFHAGLRPVRGSRRHQAGVSLSSWKRFQKIPAVTQR